MARDRDEEQEINSIPMGRIELNPNMQNRRVSMRISTPIPGYCVITDAWVTAVGSEIRLASVAVNTAFVIHCAFSAVNSGGGQWTLAITAISTDGQVKNFASENSGILGGTTIARTNEKINVLSPSNLMPSGTGALIIRMKLWMIDGLKGTMDYPPMASW